jgi:hypothetical protein
MFIFFVIFIKDKEPNFQIGNFALMVSIKPVPSKLVYHPLLVLPVQDYILHARLKCGAALKRQAYFKSTRTCAGLRARTVLPAAHAARLKGRLACSRYGRLCPQAGKASGGPEKRRSKSIRNCQQALPSSCVRHPVGMSQVFTHVVKRGWEDVRNSILVIPIDPAGPVTKSSPGLTGNRKLSRKKISVWQLALAL